MTNVLDYAFNPHPSTGALKGANIRGVGRYVSESPINDTNGKNLTPGENNALKTAGISVVLFAEEGASDMLGGFARGKERAQHFNAVVKALGRPDAVMVCTADFDATPANQTPINAYLDGAASVLGRDRVGLYGGYYPVSRALNAGKVKHAVQTFAWSRFSTAFNAAEFDPDHLSAMEGGVATNLAGNPFALDTGFEQGPTLVDTGGKHAMSVSLPSHAVLVSRVSARSLPGSFLFDDRAGLRQGLIGSFNGASVDFDEAVLTDYCQHPRPSSGGTSGPTWQWYTVDGNESLAGVIRRLNPQLPKDQQIRPAQVLRMTVEKNNGEWDPPGANGVLGDWVNLVLGDGPGGASPDPHTAIGKGAKLWVLRP